MSWRHRLAVTGAAVALLATGAVPASGHSPESRAPGVASTADAPGGRVRQITLITGDRVELATAPDGKQLAAVHPAPGSSGHMTATVKGETHVYPYSALPLIKAGKLDKELFNVTRLASYGYDDARTKSLPLIVTYGSPSGVRAQGRAKLAAEAAVPEGSRRTRVFSGIDGAALSADKSRAAEFWASLTGGKVPAKGAAAAADAPAPSRLASGVAKVWLDGKVTADLEQSVPQIGAPQAWKAGYDGKGVKVAVLDTGVDPDHPDLAGKIVEARNFSPNPDAVDHNGHGTHVAGTIAGSGAASDGRRKGAAPGAQLYVGKVLDNGGSGTHSAIIAGMDWAARTGAPVVSMSLGGAATDGTDPLSSEVDALTAKYGTLFVIAAGNAGAQSTVAAPGAADSALTVGAVNKQDALAPFSSRGPRIGDFAVKPDLTAPGVDIVAARAAGTQLGGHPIVDEHYIGLSGTSMATPHVAAAAAILKQAHPHWAADRLKDALVSSTKAQPDAPYAGGSGRLDVARAITQRVVADAAVGFGSTKPAAPGTTPPPLERTVTYHNTSDKDVTLDLALADNAAAPSGLFSLRSPSVTVPAGGTATATVDAAPAGRSAGLFGTQLVATERGGTDVVRTSVALRIGAPDHKLTLRFRDAHGNVPCFVEPNMLYDMDGNVAQLGLGEDGVITMTLPEDRYGLSSVIHTCTPGTVDDRTEYTVADVPEIDLTKDTEITLDARKAHPVTLRTPRPADPYGALLTSMRRGSGEDVWAFQSSVPGHGTRVSALPTKPVTSGDYLLNMGWEGHEPLFGAAAAEIPGHDRKPGKRLRLHPHYVLESPRLDGRRSVPLVHVGTGTEADLRKHDLHGAVVVVEVNKGAEAVPVARRARELGAIGLIGVTRVQEMHLFSEGLPLPVIRLTVSEGQALVDLLDGGRGTFSFDAVARERYTYSGSVQALHRIPDAPVTGVMTTRGSALIDRVYHGERAYVWTTQFRVLRTPLGALLQQPDKYERPTNVKIHEWHQANGDLYETSVARMFAADTAHNETTHGQYRLLTPGAHLRESYGRSVIRPRVPTHTAPFSVLQAILDPQPKPADPGAYRHADEMGLAVSAADDGAGPGQEHLGNGMLGKVTSSLYRDGTKVATYLDPSMAMYRAVDRDPAAYRYVYDTVREGLSWSQVGTRTHTEWSFSSGSTKDVTALPLVQVGYDVPVDLKNRASAGKRFSFDLTGYQIDPSLPKVTGMKAWASVDDGKTWTPLDLDKKSGDRWQARTANPAGGFVSLRVLATDAAGNSVDQTVIRAYAVAGSR
ncbi:S8 family serine peptidase [Streptomyces sp. NBC_01579]|uniref:S8 family serine peptidase n=1 Tax=Streptomyces sp. NBC_01579 TaxID=2975885 RepID=UPI00386CFBD2